ncbi:MAG: phosphoribosylanthranilate isomerase [Alicyclobacillaceae bacterium]|nr:phosphoribosylanthranilate isomerase [Alicyclobacillaceae bacterium]
MRVKICGIQSEEDMRTALAAGADALGFLVGITHLAEDQVTIDLARHLVAKLPPFVSSVAVTHLRTAAEISELVQAVRCTTVQVHDDVDVGVLSEVRRNLPSVKVIKAVHVTGPEALAYARHFEPYADALLLDSRTENRIGGTGRTHDWNISRQIVREIRIPVILAGGLNPDNVADAVQKVRPYGVDVNSGVERNGRKDPSLCRRFADRARAATNHSQPGSAE